MGRFSWLSNPANQYFEAQATFKRSKDYIYTAGRRRLSDCCENPWLCMINQTAVFENVRHVNNNNYTYQTRLKENLFRHTHTNPSWKLFMGPITLPFGLLCTGVQIARTELRIHDAGRRSWLMSSWARNETRLAQHLAAIEYCCQTTHSYLAVQPIKRQNITE